VVWLTGKAVGREDDPHEAGLWHHAGGRPGMTPAEEATFIRLWNAGNDPSRENKRYGELWKIERSTMARREAFEQQLIEVLQRSSKHYMGWLRATLEDPSITPMSLSTLLWSMREDGLISRAELAAMLARLDEVTWRDPQPEV
jgi:hypothetical protein